LKPATLDQWLEYIERQHPTTIELGLQRVNAVCDALRLKPAFPIITVGGTNGKGSCCALLEAMLLAAGYRVGCYTSPHLLRYNERVRIVGREVDDAALCRAFERIESARGETTLTYFEFGTLAALLVFADARLEAAILEVGLGGRLDAVNAFDADCALVASIDLDHGEYLGNTRAAVGFEKAGIFRAGKPAVCADRDPPPTLLSHAAQIGAELLRIGRDFDYMVDNTQWQYRGPGGKRFGLPLPALRGVYQLDNASACIAALDCLRDRLPVAAQDIRNGLAQVALPARFQVLPGRPATILDVAHNPQAARALAANLAALPPSDRTIAVCGILRDKDIGGIIAAVGPRITHWHVATLEGPRGTNARRLADELQHAGITAPVTQHAAVAGAWHAACKEAGENDKIVVFGSFLTVAAVMRERANAGF
jgi:dihydrofolate synthase/folylpolyglutamate synthase